MFKQLFKRKRKEVLQDIPSDLELMIIQQALKDRESLGLKPGDPWPEPEYDLLPATQESLDNWKKEHDSRNRQGQIVDNTIEYDFFTENNLGEAQAMLTFFGINSPEAVIEFKAESDEGEFWDVDIKQRFYYADRLLCVDTHSMSHDYEEDEMKLDLIATTLGFDEGATKIHITRSKASFTYPNGETVTKHLITKTRKKGYRTNAE